MPLESLTCTKCGSADVKEVKADTFFCNHCESIFKHVDPSRVTMRQEFCECGKAVKARCVGCGKQVCAEHALHLGYGGFGFEGENPVVGGYVERGYHELVAGRVVLTHMLVPTRVAAYRLAFEEQQDLRLYSYLPLEYRQGFVVFAPGKSAESVLVDTLGGRQGVRCGACAAVATAEMSEEGWGRVYGEGVGDDVAEGKLDGRLCVDFACPSEATATCSCCHLRFCDEHLDSATEFAVEAPRGTGQSMLYGGHKTRVELGDRRLCRFCTPEWGHAFRNTALEVWRSTWPDTVDPRTGEIKGPYLRSAKAADRFRAELDRLDHMITCRCRPSECGRFERDVTFDLPRLGGIWHNGVTAVWLGGREVDVARTGGSVA